MLLYKSEEKTNDVLRYARIGKDMKEAARPFVTSETQYRKGRLLYLNTPIDAGVSIGADKNGFFAFTHRARSKSFESPDKIPQSVLKRVESTG